MSELRPIYTQANCHPAYQLRWSITLFWRSAALCSDWLPQLKAATESDGIRILRHYAPDQATSQFLVSTRPNSAPKDIIRSVKGRLQHVVRDELPKAFRRNYSITSVGFSTREVIEGYVSSQVGHHQMADAAVQRRLKPFQICRSDVDLAAPLSTAHGRLVYNLHVVIVNEGRWCEVAEVVLKAIRRTVLGVAAKKQHRLSRAGLFADHLHLAVGCNVDQSPCDVALAYLNNLAYVQGMKPVYKFGYYVGTFGEYDFGAMK